MDELLYPGVVRGDELSVGLITGNRGDVHHTDEASVVIVAVSGPAGTVTHHTRILRLHHVGEVMVCRGVCHKDKEYIDSEFGIPRGKDKLVETIGAMVS